MRRCMQLQTLPAPRHRAPSRDRIDTLRSSDIPPQPNQQCLHRSRITRTRRHADCMSACITRPAPTIAHAWTKPDTPIVVTAAPTPNPAPAQTRTANHKTAPRATDVFSVKHGLRLSCSDTLMDGEGPASENRTRIDGQAGDDCRRECSSAAPCGYYQLVTLSGTVHDVFCSRLQTERGHVSDSISWWWVQDYGRAVLAARLSEDPNV